MEKKYKERFAFAMSSFARMYGPKGITNEMTKICKDWATTNNEPPLGSLTKVDFYFRDVWNYTKTA
jgi:hypothetical protein|tara:strand:+ start:236 stop:433 length:198 start_codon:yes stop_codon:yes gene_type:complete